VIFLSNEKRATKITKTRHYRVTKKNPQSQKLILKIDRGAIEQTISLFFPPNTEVKDHESTKEPNPNLIRINFGQTSLIFYLDTEKGFVYDKDKLFSGSFEKHDLIYLYSRIGQLIRRLKKPIGYSTV